MNFIKNKYFLLTVIFIVLLALFSSGGYKYLKKQERLLKKDITRLKSNVDSLNVVVLESETKLLQLDKKDKNYYYEYTIEKNKRIKAEKELNNIRNLTFDRKYLDSLAANIRFH